MNLVIILKIDMSEKSKLTNIFIHHLKHLSLNVVEDEHLSVSTTVLPSLKKNLMQINRSLLSINF